MLERNLAVLSIRRNDDSDAFALYRPLQIKFN